MQRQTPRSKTQMRKAETKARLSLPIPDQEKDQEAKRPKRPRDQETKRPRAKNNPSGRRTELKEQNNKQATRRHKNNKNKKQNNNERPKLKHDRYDRSKGNIFCSMTCPSK
jgi:hypothetical protein